MLAVSSLAWSPPQDDWAAQQFLYFGVQAIDITPSKYFDLTAPDLVAAAALRRWWQERGITITGLQSLLFGYPKLQVFGSVEVQRNLLEHMERVCALGAALGAQQLTFGSPKQRIRGSLTIQDAWEQGLNFFAEVGERAAQQGITLALEPNPPEYGADFLTSTLETAQFVRELNHPAVRLQLDTGALILEGSDPTQVLPQVSDVVSHLHLSLPYLKPLDKQLTNSIIPELIRQFIPENVILVAEMLPPVTLEEWEVALDVLQHYARRL